MDIQKSEMDGTESTENISQLMRKENEKNMERMKSEEGHEKINCKILALSAYSGEKTNRQLINQEWSII